MKPSNHYPQALLECLLVGLSLAVLALVLVPIVRSGINVTVASLTAPIVQAQGVPPHAGALLPEAYTVDVCTVATPTTVTTNLFDSDNNFIGTNSSTYYNCGAESTNCYYDYNQGTEVCQTGRYCHFDPWLTSGGFLDTSGATVVTGSPENHCYQEFRYRPLSERCDAGYYPVQLSTVNGVGFSYGDDGGIWLQCNSL